MLVVLALGFFTRRASASRCAPASRPPRGQRYAGLAMGPDVRRPYRYVLLPMAFPHRHPAAHQRIAMNIVKNSSVAFAVGASPS